MVCGAGLDIPSSDVPGIASGSAEDDSVDMGEFWPLKVGAVCIKGVLFPMVVESEELSCSLLVVVEDMDVLGDVGYSSNFFGDVGLWESARLVI